jgi:tetratricopeptide (TPR) repeat protein
MEPPCNFRRAEIRDTVKLFKLPGINPSPFETIRCMDRYVSVFVLCLIAGLVFGMGSGTAGGGSGSSGGGSGTSGGGAASGGGSSPSQIEESGRAVRLYNQGVRAMNSKKFAEAQAWFAQALTENPRFAEAHNYLGYSLQMEGSQNYLMALEHYNQAIQLKPNLAEAYEYRGVLLLKMGRKSDAKKDLATLKTMNPRLAVELERAMKRGKEASGSAVKYGLN